MTLGEVGHFGGPVIHFGVDVHCVLAVPGRSEAFVPQSLQVRGLAARAAAGNEQVAAKLKVEGCELRIVTILRTLEPFIRWQFYLVTLAQVQCDAAKQFLVVVHVRGSQCGPFLFLNVAQRFEAGLCRVGARILKILEACCRRKNQRHGICAADIEPAIL